MAVFLAVLVPSVLNYVDHSKVQKDESAESELVNAVNLAMSDSQVFDEVYSYCVPNNYVTYTDSSGKYSSQIVDQEYWAPDGAGAAVTVTFNPEGKHYNIAHGIVNDMTYGNGSRATPRTAEGELKQGYLEELPYLYGRVKQVIGDQLAISSNTYRNSSYTVFIRFDTKDNTKVSSVYGLCNGTNLSEECQVSNGSGTSSYDTQKKPVSTVTGGIKTYDKVNFTASDLGGSGSVSITPSYKLENGIRLIIECDDVKNSNSRICLMDTIIQESVFDEEIEFPIMYGFSGYKFNGFDIVINNKTAHISSFGDTLKISMNDIIKKCLDAVGDDDLSEKIIKIEGKYEEIDGKYQVTAYYINSQGEVYKSWHSTECTFGYTKKITFPIQHNGEYLSYLEYNGQIYKSNDITISPITKNENVVVNAHFSKEQQDFAPSVHFVGSYAETVNGAHKIAARLSTTNPTKESITYGFCYSGSILEPDLTNGGGKYIVPTSYGDGVFTIHINCNGHEGDTIHIRTFITINGETYYSETRHLVWNELKPGI